MGWPSGTSIDSQDTLAFSALSGVRPLTEVFPLERAAEGYERMMSGKARFRVVLTTGRRPASGRVLRSAGRPRERPTIREDPPAPAGHEGGWTSSRRERPDGRR